MVKINGDDVDVAGVSVISYLAKANYELKHIVVELNDKILPKSCYEQTVLKDGDVLEIVSFVGGG